MPKDQFAKADVKSGWLKNQPGVYGISAKSWCGCSKKKGWVVQRRVMERRQVYFKAMGHLKNYFLFFSIVGQSQGFRTLGHAIHPGPGVGVFTGERA
jgi:hypothetical protein